MLQKQSGTGPDWSYFSVSQCKTWNSNVPLTIALVQARLRIRRQAIFSVILGSFRKKAAVAKQLQYVSGKCRSVWKKLISSRSLTVATARGAGKVLSYDN